MKTNLPTTLAAVAVIGIGAFFAGRNTAPQDDATTETQEQTGNLWTAGRNSAVSRDFEAGTPRGRESQRRSTLTGSAGANSFGETLEKRLTALSDIVRSGNPLDRNRALLEWLDALPPGEFPEALAHFRSLGITTSRMGEYSVLLSAWAKADPTTALEYTTKNTQGRFATNTVLATWASADPDAALQWAEANHEGTGPNRHLPAIIGAISETDPTRATDLLTAMPRSNERGEALDGMLPALVAQGADAARAWIAKLDDASLKNGAMVRFAAPLAQIDPQGTVSWLLENPSEATQRRMDDVFSTWAGKDQAAATAALATLPAGKAKTDALRGIVSNVAVSNPTEAVGIMRENQAAVDNRVIENFVWHSIGKEPEIALSQIGNITDQNQRGRMYQRTLRYWSGRDPAAAAAWIAKNPQLAPQR